jgi:PAS domain S-box-containing protein
MLPAKANRPRLAAFLALAGATALLGLALLAPSGPQSPALVRTSYDLLHIAAADAPATNVPVVIVYLDLPSFLREQRDPSLPWPREFHARLVRRLAREEARAVLFDVVFSDPGPDPAADEALARAVRENGHVILAAEFNNKGGRSTSTERTRSTTLRPPCELLARVAAGWGIASQVIDDDFVVRRNLAGFETDPSVTAMPSLTWAAAVHLQLPCTQGPGALPEANASWLRYHGPPLALPFVSFSDAISPDGVPEGFFRGKIVLVGARPMTELFKARQDEFRSPFHSWGHKELFMPGVEVHATQMLNLLGGESLRRLAPGRELLLVLLAALLAGGLVWLRPVPAALAAAAGAALVTGLSVHAFSGGVWFPFLVLVAAQIPAALGGSVLFNSVEWLRARRRFEAAKREADAKIREQAALIDKAHDAILVQNLEGEILYANPSAERLYGWTPGGWQTGRALEELFAPDPAAAVRARAAVIESGEWNGELRQQTRAGRIVIADNRWTLIRDDAGRPRALLHIISDVTEKKELEAQFLRTQRMNTIGTLAGGMAHDLNNALAPILLGVQLLRRKLGDDESARLLGLMETSTNRGADMVRQILLFARGRGGEFNRLELAPLVKELEKMVRETFPKNIVVETFLPADLWPVRGNPTQLHQVLLNLCVNARDAMPAGGCLSFAADNVELGAVEAAEIPGGKPGAYVSLLVSDTGAGMPPEIRARIFEPFFTTKGEGRGTGIGLATVMRIIKSHDGFLRVESEPGQGTTFEVFLPRAIEGETAVVAAPKAVARGNGELILAVDDEHAICELIEVGLGTNGYRVVTAADGGEALRVFAQHAREVKLVITDAAMPGLDGFALARQLRAQRPDLRVIVASGEAVAIEPNDAGALTFLQKPFTLDELGAAVARALADDGKGGRP